MKFALFLLCTLLAAFTLVCMYPDAMSKAAPVQPVSVRIKDSTTILKSRHADLQNTMAHTSYAYRYALQHHYNTSVCLLVDMSIASGKNRLFVYNFIQHKITGAGLVAHGSCNFAFLSNARFSNSLGCGCTAYGKYKIGSKYNGRFGTAYKLYGLDSSNSHAFERNIVLHSYDGVPDKETYPIPICNSLGCVMVSTNF